jgi:hypothetical protein
MDIQREAAEGCALGLAAIALRDVLDRDASHQDGTPAL